MKKTLVMGSAIFLALIWVFSACEGVTTTETIQALPGPANLKAVNEYEGVITLTWDPVYDANGYELWRKAGDDPAVNLPTVAPNPLFVDGSNRYDDIISIGNVLKNGVAYTYTVVAVSSTSTSRAVDVIQNGVSSVSITPANIPEPGNYNVPAVSNPKTELVSLPGEGAALQISWDKISNPGVTYTLQFKNEPIPSYSFFLSPDGTRVVYNYKNISSLQGEENYTAAIIAYYTSGYYNSISAVDTIAKSTYTHGTVLTAFSVTPIIKSLDGDPDFSQGYDDVSVQWRIHSPEDSGDIKYALYKSEGSITDTSYFDWQLVPITTPKIDGTDTYQVTLTGTSVPAFRRVWTYKLAAVMNDEEIASKLAVLNTSAWEPVPYITAKGERCVEVDGSIANKTLTIQLSQFDPVHYVDSLKRYTGLYVGDELYFYAAPRSFINSTDQVTDTTAADYEYLAQYTEIGHLGKKALESDKSEDRRITKILDRAGYYDVIAILKNSTTNAITKFKAEIYGDYKESGNYAYFWKDTLDVIIRN
jgi:hypothetical protein